MTTQPSKPRLRLIRKLWHCRSVEQCRSLGGLYSGEIYVGVGYTPLEAYEDWKKGRVR